MAEICKIGDIAKQLNTAARIVVDSDFFWVYAASGQQVKIPAAQVRNYLVNGASLSDSLYKKAVGLRIETSETTLELIPNQLYVWKPTVTKLNITFASGDSETVNEYMMRFKVGTGEVSISLPAGVRWVDEPDWTSGSTYEVSIQDGLAVYAEWEE